MLAVLSMDLKYAFLADSSQRSWGIKSLNKVSEAFCLFIDIHIDTISSPILVCLKVTSSNNVSSQTPGRYLD